MDNGIMAVTPSQLAGVLAAAIAEREPVLISGGPGIGKSDVVTQAAESLGIDLMVTHPVTADPTDYKGLPFKGDGAYAEWLPFGDLRRLLTATEPLVCFLDDLGQAAPSVQAALMQLVLSRRINEHAISDCVTFVAATNRREDRAAVGGILEPLKGRFTILTLTPSVDDWTLWAVDHAVPDDLIAFVRFRPDMLTAWEPSPHMTNGATPRTIATAGRWVQHATKHGLDDSALLALLTGAAGQGFSVEYLAFRRHWREMPSIDGILLTPATAPVPQHKGVLCCVVSALLRRLTDQTASAVFKYAQRLPAEHQVMLVKLGLRKYPDLATVPGFAAWAASNHSLFSAAA